MRFVRFLPPHLPLPRPRPAGRAGRCGGQEKARGLYQPRPYGVHQPRRRRPHPHPHHHSEALLSRPRHRSHCRASAMTTITLQCPDQRATACSTTRCSAATSRRCPGRSICRATTIPGPLSAAIRAELERGFEGRVFFQAASFSSSARIAEPISDVRDGFAALRLDVGGAQALGQRRGDRLVDHVGLLARLNE